MEQRQKDMHRLENKVKAMSEELMKGNEIIKKLQGEIKNYHAKVNINISRHYRVKQGIFMQKLVSRKQCSPQKFQIA